MSHQFNILDYLDRLEQYGKLKYHQTWIQAVCPICSGKLKLSLVKRGAYSCYTNQCEKIRPNPIRKLLFTKTAFNQTNSFTREVILPHLAEIVNPVPLKVKSKAFLTKAKFVKPHVIFTTEEEDVIERGVSFRYNDFEMVRVDRRDRKNNFKSKFFYPRYFDEVRGEYVNDLPSFSSLPIYMEKYIQDAVIFVEGEKCATVGHKLGIATITIPSFAMSDLYFDTYVKSLVDKVQNVIYLEDNDNPGRLKAKQLVNRFWKYNIAAKSINVAKLYGYEQIEGFDIYDLHRAGKLEKNNILDFLEACITHDTNQPQ